MKLSMMTFMVVTLVIGLVITVFAFKISTATKNCNDEKVNSAVKGLIAIGVILISVPATFIACGCSAASLSNKMVGTMFVTFFTALGIVLITLSSIIHNSNCGVIKSDTSILISCGSIMTGLGVLYLLYKMYTKLGKTKAVASFM